MDPQVEGQETGAATVVIRGSPIQHEVVTNIMAKGRTFTSSYEEEAAVMESTLSRTFTNTNHPSISILFSQTVNPCVKLSSHPIPKYSQSTIPSTPYRLPSSSNGSLAILLCQIMI